MSERPFLYFEDYPLREDKRLGPFVVTREELERYLELSGENHPIHMDDAFAERVDMGRRILPGLLVHQTASRNSRAGEDRPYAVVALRWAHYDYLAPVHVDQPFWVVSRVESKEVIDKRRGTVEALRRILDEKDNLLTVARLNMLVLRRPDEREDE